jgi:hypothetical protein
MVAEWKSAQAIDQLEKVHWSIFEPTAPRVKRQAAEGEAYVLRRDQDVLLLSRVGC